MTNDMANGSDQPPGIREIDERMGEAMDRAYQEPGGWMSLSSGGFWFFSDPSPLDVNIIDVAYGLARQTRYNGQYRTDIDFYSVSEHSRKMLESLVEETDRGRTVLDHEIMLEDALAMLLHDMPEDLIGDMLSMLKKRFPDFRTFEDQHFEVRFAGFVWDNAGVEIQKKTIKEFDVRIRVNERDALIVEPSATVGRKQEKLPWLEGEPKPLSVRIDGNTPRVEARLMLEAFAATVENYPARLPVNAPENNPLLLRNYMIACDHIGRDPDQRMVAAAEAMIGAETAPHP